MTHLNGLKELNILVKWFPGVKRIPFDDNDMKEIFHNIMPQADQEAYTDTGKQWYDENVTIHKMVQYFTNADSKRKRNYWKNKRLQKQKENANRRTSYNDNRGYKSFLQKNQDDRN